MNRPLHKMSGALECIPDAVAMLLTMLRKAKLQGGEDSSGSKFMRTGEGIRTPPEAHTADELGITDAGAAEADAGIFGDWSDDDVQI